MKAIFPRLLTMNAQGIPFCPAALSQFLAMKPWVTSAMPIMAAPATSASSSTIVADLPPSSRKRRLRVAPPFSMMRRKMGRSRPALKVCSQRTLGLSRRARMRVGRSPDM
jgi:hypothetical protein